MAGATPSRRIRHNRYNHSSSGGCCMDSALKQRLLGAAVLIALAIIFVPMFLGNAPPKQDSTTVNLDIPPPPERKFETRTLPVETPSANTAPAPTQSDGNKVVTVDTHAPARPDARPEDGAIAPAATPVKPEPKPLAVAEPKVSAPVTTPPVAAPPVAVPPTTPTGRFAVHLGMYADRAAAEAARLKIKQIEPKVPSSVVESSEQLKADAPASALAANRAGGWAVQLGAFKSEAEANKLRDRVRGGGIVAFVDRTGTDQALWRVRAGPYADRGGADSARTGIKQKFQLDGMIVTQP